MLERTRGQEGTGVESIAAAAQRLLDQTKKVLTTNPNAAMAYMAANFDTRSPKGSFDFTVRDNYYHVRQSTYGNYREYYIEKNLGGPNGTSLRVSLDTDYPESANVFLPLTEEEREQRQEIGEEHPIVYANTPESITRAEAFLAEISGR